LLNCSKVKLRKILEATMRARKQIDTTLGELIVAVSDAVSPLTHNRTNANVLVSYILSDLVASRRVRLKKNCILKLA
jgi:hypothetical protein